MIVNEDLILEVVKPGTGEPVPDGDVGEIVVTSLDLQHPWIRLALGDLTAVLPGPSPGGRSNMRIKGWLGRADQTTKIKGGQNKSQKSASAIQNQGGCASWFRAPVRSTS
jgi:phenylacetate-CoA ligase